MTRPAPSRRLMWSGTGVVIAGLVGLNLLQHFWPGRHLWLSLVCTAALLVFARLHGLSWAQLGLARDRWRSGIIWGGGAIAAVALVYGVGLAIPLTRTAFLDARYHLPVPDALLSAFVLIPLGTVLLEEIAFRSVLWGMLARHAAAWRVLVTTSLLFGAWRALSSLGLGTANAGVGEVVASAGPGGRLLLILGTVAFTALGGAVMGELRRRSGSVLASVGLHWATNALGVLFGVLAWKLLS